MNNESSISATEGNSEAGEVGEVVVVEVGDGDEEEDMGLYLKDGEYNVEKLLDMKVEKGKKMILVKWQGYPNSQNTWEPIENLDSIPTMVADFEKEYAKKSQQKSLDKQATKTTRSHHPVPKERTSLKRFATASLTNESITKKIKGNSENEAHEEEYDAGEESSPTGEQSPVVEIVEEEIVESKTASSKSNQKKTSKPQLKTAKDLPQKKVYSHKKRDNMGRFRQKDKPLCIKGVKPGKNNEFFFIVEWEKRSDGTKPEDSHVSNEEFKTYAPKFLFEFYESKLVIFSRKKKSQRENEQSSKNENEELKSVFDNPVDSKKFSDKDNNQMFEEMSRELDAHSMDDNKDESVFPI